MIDFISEHPIKNGGFNMAAKHPKHVLQSTEYLNSLFTDLEILSTSVVGSCPKIRSFSNSRWWIQYLRQKNTYKL